MIDEGFYFFERASFGELRGYRKLLLSQQEQQSLLDNNTRERLGVFNPPSGLSSSDYSGMFLSEFLKARQQTREQDVPTIPFVVTVQIGNSESLNEVSIIEKDNMFLYWENPMLVDQFKEYSKIYLSE